MKNEQWFVVSQGLWDEYERAKVDWNDLWKQCMEWVLSPKDLIVLQLYLIFMDIEVDGEDNIYKTMITMMQEQGSQERFDPDQSFQFNSVNTDKIKELLIGLNQERFLNSEVSKLVIFDVFTNVIIEALQFLGFIPYAIE